MLLHDPAVTTLEPLRYVRSVSAPLSPAYARRFHERFGIAVLNGYGQTELGGEAVGWTAADWKEHGVRKLGSVGRPHAAFEVRVRATDGELAATDEVGELEIHSTSALPPADAAMEGRVTDDGWLRTGDLGAHRRRGLRVDQRPRRIDDQPRRPEGVSRRGRGGAARPRSHRRRRVVGVPDDRLGEVPWAFVVAKPGATVDPEQLRAWCRDRLAPYKIPAGVTVVAALPRNEMGKLLRHTLMRRH